MPHLLFEASDSSCISTCFDPPTTLNLDVLPVSREWKNYNSGETVTELRNTASVTFCNVEGLEEQLVMLRSLNHLSVPVVLEWSLASGGSTTLVNWSPLSFYGLL